MKCRKRVNREKDVEHIGVKKKDLTPMLLSCMMNKVFNKNTQIFRR